MPKTGTYYLVRLSKINLDHKQIIDSFKEPTFFTLKEYTWTITNFLELKDELNNDYYFAKLSKFMSEGAVKVIDREYSKEKEKPESDLIIASSPFLYIPRYSGIIFLHVWNQIEQITFMKRLRDLILEKYDRFFVDCEIEAISDLESFLNQLMNLSSIQTLKAKVRPPNPFFGHLWESLKDYLKKRNVSELKIEEKSQTDKLLTNLIELIKNLLTLKKEEIKKIDSSKIGFGDTALLMAIDGYGEGKIEGKKENKKVIIKTNDMTISIQHSKEPIPAELYKEAIEKFDKINRERYMDH